MPNSLYRPLLDEAVDDFRREIESAIKPYPDWSRPFPDAADEAPPERFLRGSADAFIRELKSFLGDPDTEVHHFRHRQEICKMIEDYIRHNRLDLDLRTEKKGTPHTLVCTKNDHSHRTALATRKKDEKLLEKLKRLK